MLKFCKWEYPLSSTSTGKLIISFIGVINIDASIDLSLLWTIEEYSIYSFIRLVSKHLDEKLSYLLSSIVFVYLIIQFIIRRYSWNARKYNHLLWMCLLLLENIFPLRRFNSISAPNRTKYWRFFYISRKGHSFIITNSRIATSNIITTILI